MMDVLFRILPSVFFVECFQALHSEIFPTKSCLQLKIREVRQKVMAQSTTSTTASSTSHTNTSAGINPATGSSNTSGYGPESADVDMMDAHDANEVLDLATTNT